MKEEARKTLRQMKREAMIKQFKSKACSRCQVEDCEQTDEDILECSKMDREEFIRKTRGEMDYDKEEFEKEMKKQRKVKD